MYHIGIILSIVSCTIFFLQNREHFMKGRMVFKAKETLENVFLSLKKKKAQSLSLWLM